MSHTPTPRILPYDEVSEMAAMIIQILSLRQQVEAIAVFPGLGEIERIKYTTSRWHSDERLKRCFIAGANPNERTYKKLDMESLCAAPHFWQRTEGVETQLEAMNTLDQAKWLVGKIRSRVVTKIGLVAPAYHMPRAYLTVLKHILNARLRVLLIAEPVHYAPDTVIPEIGCRADDMIPGEIDRIRRYALKGDVATRQELTDYLEAFR